MATKLLEDRRALLRFLLRELQDSGREVLLPVGCNDFDDWLLDSLAVDRLIRQINSSSATLDLITACSSNSAGRKTLSPGRPTPGADDAVTDFRELLMDGSGGAAARAGSTNGIGGEADEEGRRIPQLKLKSLTVELEEYQMKELAYAIFQACCGGRASPGLLATLRAQLEINEARAAELQRIITLVGQHGVTSLATLEMHIKLLQIVRPSAFDSFKNFVRWRDTVTSVVWLVLNQAVRQLWVAGPDGGPQANGSSSASARSLLARLRGGLRRLDVRDADDYDDAEYTEAAQAVFVAAGQLADHCQSGWNFPWALRARLAELLLRGVFDTLDEGSYVEGRQELLGLLQAEVWRELEITDDVHHALYSWVHFRQYTVSKELKLLETARSIAAQVTPHAAIARPSGSVSGDAGGTEGELQGHFPTELMGLLSQAICDILGHYHRDVSDPREMKGLLALLDAAETARGRKDELPRTLEGCISASMEAAFKDASNELATNVTVEEDRIMLLAATTGETFQKEATTYSPLLLPLQPEARMIAARALHELFGAQMLPWLVGVNGLTKSALEAIRASMELEDQLVLECKEKPVTPWGTMERLSPLLYTWAQGQISMLAGWQDRILAGEEWTRQSKQRSGASRSVVETIKIVTETLEALFDMQLAVPAGVVRCLIEGVDGCMARYCEFVRKQVGNPDVLVPEPPPLTRYKRELAVQAEEMERASGARPPTDMTGKVKQFKYKMDTALTMNWLPPAGSTEEEARLLALSYDSLVVRLNSVQHLLDSLGGLQRMVVERWDEDRLKSAKKREGNEAYDWVNGMFDGARTTGGAVRDFLCRFIAMKLVFGDLRELIYERLYRFRVAGARLEIVLQEVDRNLGDICSRVHDALPGKLARSVCGALCLALQNVLLDGGPLRLFTVQDIDLLEADVAQMRAMFFADGEGLSLEEIDAICRPLSDLLDVMQLDTGLIVQNLQAGGSRRSTPRDNSLAMDSDVLLRILCHRADHAASKYLKKEYKVPKKLPTVVTASVTTATKKTGGLLSRLKSEKSAKK